MGPAGPGPPGPGPTGHRGPWGTHEIIIHQMNENSIKAANTFSVDHLIDCCSSKFKLVI